jgi:hypothetical protein
LPLASSLSWSNSLNEANSAHVPCDNRVFFNNLIHQQETQKVIHQHIISEAAERVSTDLDHDQSSTRNSQHDELPVALPDYQPPLQNDLESKHRKCGWDFRYMGVAMHPLWLHFIEDPQLEREFRYHTNRRDLPIRQKICATASIGKTS